MSTRRKPPRSQSGQNQQFSTCITIVSSPAAEFRSERTISQSSPPYWQHTICLNKQQSKEIQNEFNSVQANFWKQTFVAGRTGKNRAQMIPEISLNPSFSGEILLFKAKWVCSEENPCGGFLRSASICSQRGSENRLLVEDAISCNWQQIPAVSFLSQPQQILRKLNCCS